MIILCCSDLHGFLPDFSKYKFDQILISGDICPTINHGTQFQLSWLNNEFEKWCAKQPCKPIICYGNHDFIGTTCASESLTKSGYILLQDNSITIDGIKIWGSPWSNRFGPWAFMDSEAELREKYDKIDDNIDILISHGPPHSCCDRTKNGTNAGSISLYNKIQELPNLQIVICGHIHEGYGVAKTYSSKIGNLSKMKTIINCSLMNYFYKPVNKPFLLNTETWEITNG